MVVGGVVLAVHRDFDLEHVRLGVFWGEGLDCGRAGLITLHVDSVWLVTESDHELRACGVWTVEVRASDSQSDIRVGLDWAERGVD